jgi:exonuclease SbcD
MDSFMRRIRPFTFVHCADLHLDSPFEGLHALDPAVAAVLREATFRAFDRVVDLAVRERADFLLIAGDVYDGEDRSLRAQLRFRDGLVRAVENGVACFVAHGNHDPLSGWEAGLSLPDKVHRFRGGEVERIPFFQDGEPLAVLSGISYPVREVRENLVPRFRSGSGDPYSIAVLHCNAGGDPRHDSYAPCSIEDLLPCGIDYWALGHIHARKTLRDQGPAIVYPGNTQGRNVRETGPRGCLLVRVDESGRADLRFEATDVARWSLKEVPIPGLETMDDLLEGLLEAREACRREAAGRAVVARITVAGRGDLHAGLRRLDPERDLLPSLRDGEARRPDFVWVESIHVATRAAIDLARRRGMDDFIGDFLKAAEAVRRGPEPEKVLREWLDSRPESKPIRPFLDALSGDELLAALDEAETRGLDLLLGEEA